MVTIVDGGPAYEGKKTKHREKKNKNKNNAEPYDCSIFKPRLLNLTASFRQSLSAVGVS
jgi:hypothetical protein